MSVNINADTTNGLVLTSDTSGELKLQSAGADIATVNSSGMAVDTNTLYVDATNNRVGVGTSSPNTLLHVQGSNSGGNIVAATLRNNNAVDSTQTSLRFTNSSADGTSGGGELSYLRNAGNQGSSFIVKTQSSVGVNTERMRIDSSGVIDIKANAIVNAAGGNGILHNGSRTIPTDGSGNALDNGKDLGQSNVRWDDIYATSGTVNTSDENEKQQIASLTTSEMNVAKEISALFKTYKWNSAVEEKGDSARTHTGIIAQDVQQAFASEGLDASHYGLWCSNTWWEKEITEDDKSYIDYKDEETEGYVEKTRLGVRYPELLSFVNAYHEQKLNDLETRIQALENA